MRTNQKLYTVVSNRKLVLATNDQIAAGKRLASEQKSDPAATLAKFGVIIAGKVEVK